MSGNIAALNLGAQRSFSAVAHDCAVMHVGRRIKRLMLEKGIGNEQVAAACEVTPGAVSNWFATGQITRDNLVVVADVLNESVRYLMTGDERDREFSAVEAEFARRDVNAGTREAILTLLRACPVRQAAPPAADDGRDADAQAFDRATRPLGTPASSRGRKRDH